MTTISGAATTDPSAPFATQQVMVGAVLISFSGVYVKWAPIGPTASAFYRVVLGGLILLAVALVRRDRLWQNRSYFGLQMFCGAIFALDLIAWHQSIIFLGPGVATILANFQVFFLAAVGIAVMNETVDWRILLTVPLALSGLVLVVGDEWMHPGTSYRAGVVLGLVTALCYTGYILSLRKLNNQRKRLSPTSNLAMVSLVSGALLAGAAMIQNQALALPTPLALAAMIAYALSSQVFGWLLISRGLPGVRPSVSGLLLLLQPTLAFVWDMLFFDLEITVKNGIGTVLALGAIYLGSTRPAAGMTHQSLKSKSK